MKEITISENDAGQRINKFLMKYLNKAPSSFIYKMLRKKNIKLNNKKADGSEILAGGDTVQIYLSDETISNFRTEEKLAPAHQTDIDVIYSDENILIANKPAGMLSQKAAKDDYSFNEAMINYLVAKDKITKEQLATFKPSVCNRLDRNTSGIILCGISLKGSQELSKLIRERQLDKYYYTIVAGCMKKNIDSKCYLVKDNEKNISYISDKPSHNGKGELIHTIYYPVKSNDAYTLLKVKLITGKSHQIRAHLKYLGYPVAGDRKYGDMSTNIYFKKKYGINNQMLHCGEVVFHELSGDLSYLSGKKFVAEFPDRFDNVVSNLF